MTQRSDDGKQLLLVHRVASLGIEHLLRHERDRLQTLALILLEHGTDGEAGGISVHDERQIGIGQDEHGSLDDGILQLTECLLLLVAPLELDVSLVSSDSGEAID